MLASIKRNYTAWIAGFLACCKTYSAQVNECNSSPGTKTDNILTCPPEPPVSCLSLNGGNGGVELEWQVQSSQNAREFIVYHRSGESDWATIGIRESRENAEQTAYYNLRHY